jgi:protein ImuB
MRRILCLHLPYLATERVRRDAAWAAEPARPLALTRPVGSSLVVEQACPRARQLGLRPGLSLAQAQALAPKLIVLAYDPQRDQAALEQLARWALRFSPLVEPVTPDTLLIDITGCQRLFDSEENIARQAVNGLAKQGFRARAAVADTIGAAYALAAAGDEPLSVAPVRQTSAYLAPLPPIALRVAPRVGEQLEALGIRSIGDLLMLPRASLPARFGSQLVLRWQQALGEVFEGVTPYPPEDVPRAYQPWEVPVTDFQPVSQAAGQLLADVLVQLRRRAAALRRLECVLYYERTAPLVISIGLARASREHSHIQELLTQRLERADLSPGVTGLLLLAHETSRWPGGQDDLFEPRTPGDDEALGCLVDRLAGRLGHEALVRPWLVDDYQPEMAFRYVPVAEAGCEPRPSDSERTLRHSERCEESSPVSHAGLASSVVRQGGRTRNDERRPLRLVARPVPIRVIAVVPDGPPAWMWYNGRQYVVVRAAGPERLETAWWRGSDVRRDYFRVAVASGEQFWIFHAAAEGRWYLHGVFT